MEDYAVRVLAPGSRVEGFVVEREIARAGDTITYRVREPQSGNMLLLREYAPGELATRNPDGEIVPRDESHAPGLTRGIAQFQADAARAVTLVHASLVRSIRSLRANGTAYLLMAVPPHPTLGERLVDRGALPAGQTARIARSLLDALEFLHARQRVHGELAPDQMLVGEDGGTLLIGSDHESSAPSSLASPGGGSGDPYAAIEQRSPGESTGPWTDIYRLAATLYHCVTGKPPPPASERHAGLAAGTGDPLRPLPASGDRDPLREELLTLIERGLRLEPEARPQSLREWRARIAHIGPEPAAATETGPAPEPRRPQVRPLLIAGLLLVALLAGGVYFSSLERAASRSAAQSAAEAERARFEAERWRQALEVNAVAGYRAFIEDFPDSPRLEQARDFIGHLEDQAWPAVLEENNRAAFEAHLEMFPDGRHATEALSRIEAFRQEEARLAREAAERQARDEAAWHAARSAGTIAALDDYLAAWPGGAFSDEARTLRKSLQADLNDAARFRQADEAKSIAAYRGYVAEFPAGRHVGEALQAIDALTLRPGKTFRDCADCPEMVVVPAGSFWQGSADASTLAISLEKPRRRVVIAEPFAVGTHEVTMEEWDACVTAGGCEAQPEDNGWGRGRRPVILVSWNDAMQYAGWLGETTGQRYALPSESEWEYVARAGEESDWLGGQPDTVCAFGNIAGAETEFDWRHPKCSDRTALSTAFAGSFKPNTFGLFDVIGNVAEWTQDCMNLSYLEAPTDGSAWTRGLCSSRMTRGGSWFSGTRDVRLPARFNLKSGDRNDFTGFRVVRRVEPQPD